MLKLWLSLVVIFMTALTGFADSVTLKSGEQLTGKIITETPQDVTIDVRVSEGVMDERTIQKSDIASMQKTPEDEIAFQSLRNLQVPQNEFTLTALDGQIGSLQNFVNTFPRSSHLAEAKANLDQFKADASRLEGGEIKLFGKWLSKREAYRNRYEIEAAQLYAEMEAQIANRDLVGSLNTYMLMEKSHPGARVYPDAIDRAKQVIATLIPEITRLLAKWNHDEDERIAGLQLVREPEKSHLISAAKEEKLRYDTIVKAAKTAGIKWVPLLPRSDASLNALQDTAGAEEQRLASLPSDAMHQSIAELDKAAKAIANKDLEVAEESAKEANSLWINNHALTELNERLNALRIALRPTPSPSPSPSPKGPPKPSPAKPAATASPVAAANPAAPPPPPPDDGILSIVMSPTGFLAIGGVVVMAAGGAFLAVRARKEKASAPQ